MIIFTVGTQIDVKKSKPARTTTILDSDRLHLFEYAKYYILNITNGANQYSEWVDKNGQYIYYI